MPAWDFLPFHPHPLCRGRHAQTVASTLPLIRLPPNRATLRFVALADGDQLALHDDQPAVWQPGNRASLMVHGLGGSHASGYMRRIAAKLNGIGERTFRLDLRGCGAGFGFAKQPYYGGCSDDLAATVRRVGELCPGSPLSLIGFSLGANVVLKLLGELRGRPLAGVDHAMAISPPIDLERSSQSLLQGFNRVYDRYFVATLMRLIRPPSDSSSRLAGRKISGAAAFVIRVRRSFHRANLGLFWSKRLLSTVQFAGTTRANRSAHNHHYRPRRSIHSVQGD